MLAGETVGGADQSAAPLVPVSRPAVRKLADHVDCTGRTQAVASADLRARVSGYIDKVHFKDGAEVKRGQLLFEIDPRPYRAELDRAEAALALGETRLKRAEADLKRATALFAAKAIGRDEFDRAAAGRAQAAAAVPLARAERDTALLRLTYTRVLAPFDGRIGRPLVDVGNVVKADDTVLATLVAPGPMYVYFDLDERTVLRFRRGKPRLTGLAVAVGLAGEKDFPRRGVVDSADNRVDPRTGTLRLRAVLPNEDGLLLPGLFARVRLTTGEPYQALLVPERAVLTEKGEKFVLVVNGKDVVERRRVEVGPLHGDWRVVKTGLKAKDWVVLRDQHKLRPGMTVKPQQEAVPGPAD
jgi:multidrug efflux system membrane fusion protein